MSEQPQTPIALPADPHPADDLPVAESTGIVPEAVTTVDEIEVVSAEADATEPVAVTEEVEASSEEAEPVPAETPITKRVVQIGDSTITLEGALASKPLDELKTLLSVSVPEIKTGEVSESASNGVSTISVKPRAGSKG